MNIGIDARMYGLEHAGIGRYIINLTDQLLKQKNHKFTLFLRKKYYSDLKVPSNTTKVLADFRHYSLKEQTQFPKVLASRELDLVHFPHFNVPLTYNRPFVVTIHDLLWHQTKGLSVTSLSPIKYILKYAAYRATVNHALAKSEHIMVPSKFVKSRIIKYGGEADKISVTYEGIDDSIIHSKPADFSKLAKKLKLTTPFIVYTGSAYPHKNLDTLVSALALYNYQANTPLKMIIISSRDIFLRRVQDFASKSGVKKDIIFAGFLSDSQVKSLYQKAICLVHPSKSEGFGLTGLEAMSVNLPVISSSAASLPEIYKDAALYVDPNSPYDIMNKLVQINKDPEIKQKLISSGKKVAKSYSWEKMTQQTLEIYQQASK